MKTKNKFFLITVLFLIMIDGYFYLKPYFLSSVNNVINVNAEHRLTANELVSNFNNDEVISKKRYSGKVVEISGIIKEINFLNDRTTVILKSDSENFGVICDINPNQKENIYHLKQNQNITVKGICKGFLKDVILLNCNFTLSTDE